MTGDELRALYAEEYRYVDDVIDCGYEFGGQRLFSGTTPTAPSSDVKATRSDPSQKQIVGAMSAGYQYVASDKVFSVWAKTLDATYSWEPMPDDVLIVLNASGQPRERWKVLTVNRTVWGAQFELICRLSPKTKNPANAAP